MSDFASSLPVRTETAGDVSVKIVDGTLTSQKLTVNADGSVNITDNSGSITVDATNLDVRDLVFATDKVDASGSVVALDAPTLAALESITVQNGAGASAVNIQDGGNAITVDAVDLDIRNLSHSQDSVRIGDGTDLALVTASGELNVLATAQPGVDVGDVTINNAAGAAAVNIQDGGNSITVDGSLTVSATDLDIRDLVAATDSVAAHIKDEAGVAFSASNPLPVTWVDSEGVEVNDPFTSAALAAAATANHDYTVTALKTLKFSQVEASASGKIKIDVSIETSAGSGVFTRRWTMFNSTAKPNLSLDIKEHVTVAAGVKVRVVITNKDNQAQDVYSTISGHEI